MNPRALYIHVPFCTRRCSYCDFAVEATREPPVSDWLAAIGRELELVAAERAWRMPLRLDSLYIGGGTPSLLGQGAMAALGSRLAPHIEIESGAEWTCEANPESFTRTLAEDWRAAGVNRVSLGVQSFDPATLEWMGRLHGPDGARSAVAAARAAGIENISIDLIFGVPDHLGRDWRTDLDATLALAPSHVSLYGLTAEPGAPLGRRVREGREVLADEDRYADEYLLAHEILTGAGFEHYEVSNFARPGLRSRHNAVYWSGAPYVALGPGAHAFDPPLRWWNLRSWAGYRDALLAGMRPVDGYETLDAGTEALEAIWLGLRCVEGYPLREVAPAQAHIVAGWERAGLAVVTADRVRLTESGWLLLDELAVDLGGRGARVPAPADVASAIVPTIDAETRLVQISANSNPDR